ncbi:hypothetical protein PK69_02155 [Xanthomonas phaseoli pv. phaseoli]|uniref:Uncharacterized protein n=1 Tax=Xanthomonas campestris pv. phaseoli TaxID=317013 RepID=A0AB34QLY2_XANCH|nr:hypothetical protein AC609_21680 [Xanthomonas phaseoli pv. phaseoli]AZU32565.1 hypothetical protein AC801_23265 [Xanthomonas sp. ISO98C4]KUF29340.1 hypothetical protein AO826_00820 [Xanthomonas phaseoli pv. manihotis]AZU27995.1 hypothetical protein AC611_21705 [Xanthomonas phaseoli pv. phaseoli]AZU36759.1 hypothetical protein AC610_21670 [Xanthomonas phaseoli pv. phaseoli]
MLAIVHGTHPGASLVLHGPVIADALHRPRAAIASPVSTRA